MKLEQIFKSQKAGEFIRFCVVGAIATGIDLAIFYSVKTIISYQMAMVLGYLISLSVNTLLTIKWTFHADQTVKNITAVVASHLINLFIVRMGLMYIFVEQLNRNSSISYIPTLAISIIVNFLMIRFFIKLQL